MVYGYLMDATKYKLLQLEAQEVRYISGNTIEIGIILEILLLL